MLKHIFLFFFFFQAEDGIRDLYVTGVQTVLFRSRPPTARLLLHELPPWPPAPPLAPPPPPAFSSLAAGSPSLAPPPAFPGRSEERRVGKECRSRWWPYREKKEEERLEVAGSDGVS